jgi:hypothetical protein
LNGLSQGNISGYSNDRNAALRDRRLNGNFQSTRHLIGLRDKFAVVAALREEMRRVRLLKVVASDFGAGNLRGDRENWNTTAMAVVQAIDQVKIPGSATACAHSQLSG